MVHRSTALVRLSALTLSLASLSAFSEESTPLPHSMAALGDSMTAAALANLRRQDAIQPWFQAYFVGEGLNWTLLTSTFGSERGMTVIDRRHLSWATGLDPYHRMTSHGSRLRYLAGGDLEIANFAVSGAALGHRDDDPGNMYETQLPKLFEWSRNELHQEAPDYVVVLIGANDICEKTTADMTPVNVYEQRITDTVDQLTARSPNTRVLLTALPNIEALRSVALDKRLMPPMLSKCQDAWNLVYRDACHTLTLEADPAERAKVAERVRAYNSVLQKVADTKSAAIGDRVRYAGATYEAAFTPDMLAVDCFHPNYQGQDVISQASWSSSWWTKEWKSKEKVYEADLAREQRQKACEARRAANPKGGPAAC